MTRTKSHRKKIQCIQHRTKMYEEALDKLFKGEVGPEYVKERSDKLKQVKG